MRQDSRHRRFAVSGFSRGRRLGVCLLVFALTSAGVIAFGEREAEPPPLDSPPPFVPTVTVSIPTDVPPAIAAAAAPAPPAPAFVSRQPDAKLVEAWAEFRNARQPLDAFLEEHFARYEAQARAPRPAPVVVAAPPQPRTVDNPEWLMLDRQLTQLRERLADLLIDRTELHPDVIETKRRMAEIEQAAAGVRRRIPAPEEAEGQTPEHQPAMCQESGSPDAAVGSAVAEDRVEASAAAQLAEVEAYRRYRQALANEETAFDARIVEAMRPAPPPVEVARHESVPELAPPVITIDAPTLDAAAAPSTSGSRRPWFAALAAGLVIAAGATMMMTGAGIDLPLVDPAEARETLAAPIVAEIHATRLSRPRSVLRQSAQVLKFAWIAGGCVTIGCVLGVLYCLQ